MTHPTDITEDMKTLGAVRWTPVGSRLTCDPPPEDADEDWLVLVRKRDAGAVSALGYELDDGGKHYEPSEGQFNSWRKGSVNLIVTDDKGFWCKFALATKVARDLNLLEKSQRVTLFQAILYDRFRSAQ